MGTHSHSVLPPRRLAETIRQPTTTHIQIGPADGEAGADEESETRVGFVWRNKVGAAKAYLVGSAIYVLHG